MCIRDSKSNRAPKREVTGWLWRRRWKWAATAFPHHQQWQLARGHSSTSVHTSTNSSSTTFNPSSLDARGNNFNPAGFAVQMPSYISGQNDQRQSFMNMNHFHQCQVTFNIGSTAAPEKPQSAPQWKTTVSCTAASWRRQYFALTDHDQFSFRKNLTCWTCQSQLELTANIINVFQSSFLRRS